MIFLGDSITDQWKNLESLRFGDAPHRVINRGTSGQLSLHMLWRLQADVLAHQPKVLVLLAGTNDIRVGSNWMERPTALQLQRLMDNLTTMVDAARARGVQVVLCTMTPSTRRSSRCAAQCCARRRSFVKSTTLFAA